MTPSHEEATLGRHFRAAIRARAAFWALFVGVSGSFLLGAYLHDVRVMAAGPLAAALVVVLFAYWVARSQASHDFWLALGPSLGMTYLGPSAIQPLTPLLAAGDERDFEHTMVGELGQGLGCTLSHYTYAVKTDREDVALSRHEYTVCAIDLVPSMPRFPGVFLRPRQGIFEGRHDWLKRLDTYKLELESILLNERYEPLAAHDQDEGAFREVFSPKLIDWLARHPLAPGLELRAGAVVVYLPGHVADAGKLSFFLDCVRHIVAAASRQAYEVRASG